MSTLKQPEQILIQLFCHILEEILLLWEQLHCPSSQGTCVSFSEQKYLMSSDQLFNILLSLLFNGIALSLIYYQPLLHTAPKTQITCFLISSLLSD